MIIERKKKKQPSYCLNQAWLGGLEQATKALAQSRMEASLCKEKKKTGDVWGELTRVYSADAAIAATTGGS